MTLLAPMVAGRLASGIIVQLVFIPALFVLVKRTNPRIIANH
jgi:hypothetical protein